MKESSYIKDIMQVIRLMKNMKGFQSFSDNNLRSLLELARLREYEIGEIVIKEGDYDCWIFFLLSGWLEILKGDNVVGHLRRLGDLFGEMGVVDGSPRSATIRAAAPCIILGVDGSVVDRKFRSHDLAFCYTIYRAFAEVLAVRLRNTTEDYIRLRKELIQKNRTDDNGPKSIA
jgi:CRP/FNR family cyclic AMP-dependent transcriptional regulator